jgi:hypothetical protein
LQLNFNQFYFLQFVFLAVLSFCLFVSFIFFSSFIFYRLPGKYSDLFPPANSPSLLFLAVLFFTHFRGNIPSLFPDPPSVFFVLAVLLYSHRAASPLLIRWPSSLKNRLCQPNAPFHPPAGGRSRTQLKSTPPARNGWSGKGASVAAAPSPKNRK